MKEAHDDLAFEPVPGLPESLPPGESMLWQGSPEWRALARSAFHVRKVAAYFALLIVWQAWPSEGATWAEALGSTLRLMFLATGAVGILCGLAYLYARTTIYTLTTRRLVIRSGLALPVTFNLPWAQVERASMTRFNGANGSIALTVTKPNRVAFLVLWPNARPWKISDPQPMLRCIEDVDGVANMLTRALAAQAGDARIRTPVLMPATLPGAADGAAAGQPVAA